LPDWRNVLPFFAPGSVSRDKISSCPALSGPDPRGSGGENQERDGRTALSAFPPNPRLQGGQSRKGWYFEAVGGRERRIHRFLRSRKRPLFRGLDLFGPNFLRHIPEHPGIIQHVMVVIEKSMNNPGRQGRKRGNDTGEFLL